MSLRRPWSRSEEPDAEAAVWLARLHADDRSPTDERAFRAWIDADPGNRAAFEHMTAAWDAAGAAQRNPYLPDGDAVPSSRVSRRALVFGSGVALLGISGAGYWQAAVAGVYETGVGEQKHVVLDDRSLLLLDTDTKVRVRYSSSRRMVDLLRGQCNFSVTRDPHRPFTVDASGGTVVAGQANFDVRDAGNGLQVVCLRGALGVKTAGLANGAPSASLSAGERLRAATGTPARVDTPDIAALASWQTGQLVFDEETLAQAVEEMNRYSPTKLVIADPQLASRRLSGVYRAGDNMAFARSVAQLLDIPAETGGTEIRLGAA